MPHEEIIDLAPTRLRRSFGPDRQRGCVGDPIRRISHHRIDTAKRRQDVSAVAQYQRRIADCLCAAHPPVSSGYILWGRGNAGLLWHPGSFDCLWCRAESATVIGGAQVVGKLGSTHRQGMDADPLGPGSLSRLRRGPSVLTVCPTHRLKTDAVFPRSSS